MNYYHLSLLCAMNVLLALQFFFLVFFSFPLRFPLNTVKNANSDEPSWKVAWCTEHFSTRRLRYSVHPASVHEGKSGQCFLLCSVLWFYSIQKLFRYRKRYNWAISLFFMHWNCPKYKFNFKKECLEIIRYFEKVCLKNKRFENKRDLKSCHVGISPTLLLSVYGNL